MADIKISQLGAAIAVNDTDVVPIVSGGNTLKATAAQLKEHAIGDTDISDLGDGTPTGAIAALNTELGTTKQALTSEKATRSKVGAHNLLNNTLTSGLGYSVNSDKSILVNISEGVSNVVLQVGVVKVNVGESYIISGTPNDGAETTYFLRAVKRRADNSWATVYPIIGEVEVTIESGIDNLLIQLIVLSGQTCNNKTFYPMVRLKSDELSDYLPFAMTNSELTENKANKTELTNISVTGTTNNTGATIKDGTYFYLNDVLVKAKTDVANGATFTLDTNYKVVSNGALNNVQVLEFDITNLSISTAWGSIYVSAMQSIDTGIYLGGKKVFAEFLSTGGSNAWIVPYQLDNTYFQAYFARGTTGNVTGKLYLMIVD